MPNGLIGDFDVVVQFSIPAANRVLAAMHRGERFPHSLTLRVDDDPPLGTRGDWFSVVAVVDLFGDPTADHTRIGTPVPLPGELAGSDPLYSALDPVVNPELVGLGEEPVVPSHLQGRAQLQLSPPTLEVTPGAETTITVRMQVLARYFPDPNTSPLAEFVRGDLRISAPVNQVATQTAAVIEVDIKASQLGIAFTPTWSSRPLSAADLEAVNSLIRNALRTSFVPTNAVLPSHVRHMQFKTLFGAPSAIAVLLNLNDVRGNPASVTGLFVHPGDAFAFAAGRDFIVGEFTSVIGDSLGQQFSFSFDIDYLLYTQHVVYTVVLTSATVDLQQGQAVLTIEGHASTGSWNLPNFSFRVRQALTVSPTGATAELQSHGDVSLEITTGGIKGWLVSRFKGGALGTIRQRRDQVLHQVQDTVRDMLSADRALGGFLRSLMNPSHPQPGGQVYEVLHPELAYTGVEIRPSGIVLHGSLAVPAWPTPHVEFEQVPPNSGGGIGPHVLESQGPDYTGLKSWIPGGAIERYEWTRGGHLLHADEHRFVKVAPPPVISEGFPVGGLVTGFTPLCLTVRGTRISASGPPVAEPVSATACGYNWVPVISGELVSSFSGGLPMVALTRPGPRGLIEVVGHAAARPAEGDETPNLIVHFADEQTAGHLDVLSRALSESRRGDGATAILAVLAPEHLGRTPHTEGVIYTEDQGGAWARLFRVARPGRPMTLLVRPNGEVVWRQDGELDREALVAALRKLPASGGPVRPRVLGSGLRVGRPAPNFLFEIAPGRKLTLRRLVGRPSVLVFWKSTSTPSLEAVRELQETTGNGATGAIVLAINDGEAPELAKQVAAENGLSATLATDPRRSIALAYGVNIWPTTVFVDAGGVVRAIRYGRVAGEPLEQRVRDRSAATGE